MSKILVIPDIHNRVDRADYIIKQAGSFDFTIFLEDYFDSYDDTPEMAERTAGWLKEKIKDDCGFFLIGNHDLSYFSEGRFQCSGFSWSKLQTIRRIITKDDIERKFSMWLYVAGNIMLSHAGLSRGFLEDWSKTTKKTWESFGLMNSLNTKHSEVLSCMFGGEYHPLFHCSKYRGGIDEFSGILWCDWNEFEPVPGIRQVFGHTSDKRVRRLKNNYCIDTGLNHYITIENGKIRIRRVD